MPRRCSYGDEQNASLRRIRKMHTDTFMQMKETEINLEGQKRMFATRARCARSPLPRQREAVVPTLWEEPRLRDGDAAGQRASG